MENLTEVLTNFILITFGILQIILFFKMWTMTNDVKNIFNLLNNQPPSCNNNSSLNSIDSDTPPTDIVNIDKMFKCGDIVRHRNKGKMLIKKAFDDNTYDCFSPNGVRYEGNFSGADLTLEA